ncbi:MAG TPA: pantoate--beta-alanine ligase [Ilumatobacteraceae bacterium]|nr:pantoate--beta-alanine ligase [Ilumatobacteraceae bacterium]
MTARVDADVLRPVVAHTRSEVADALAQTRARGGRVVLVPTMGALHEGHASLMRAAARHCGPDDAVVVSIFVNPLQFGPDEDLSRYPRTFEADLDVCAREGVTAVFAPSLGEVYPGGEPQVTIEPGPISQILEGRSRPTHFRGVLTVVAKIFGLVAPDLAVFGEKDYQQLVLIKQMVVDLCMDVEVIGAEIVREPSGLALSSRNNYLDDDQKTLALTISRVLRAGTEAAGLGGDQVLAAARAVLEADSASGIDVDYLELTGPDLGPAPLAGEARLLIAARVGSTRLIDNTALSLGEQGSN